MAWEIGVYLPPEVRLGCGVNMGTLPLCSLMTQHYFSPLKRKPSVVRLGGTYLSSKYVGDRGKDHKFKVGLHGEIDTKTNKASW